MNVTDVKEHDLFSYKSDGTLSVTIAFGSIENVSQRILTRMFPSIMRRYMSCRPER